MILPVFARNIGNYFFAAVVLKIQVDIRHFFAFQIEETLKNQLMLYRVQFGDPQAVENNTGCGAAAHSEHNIFLPDERNNVPDHQEVIGKLGALNYAQFISQTFFDFVSGIRVKTVERFITKVGEIFIRSFARG